MYKVFIIIILTLIVYDFVNSYFLYKKGIRLSAETKPFEQIIENAEKNILIIGDSTALGVGASNPEKSLAGLWAQEFPEANIKVLAENGLKFDDFEKLKDKVDEKYDFIFLHLGGNDIIRFTKIDELSEQVIEVLDFLKDRTDKLVWTSSGNIGSAPFFPLVIRPILVNRTKVVREVFMEISEEMEVTYIDLFTSIKDDPFRKDISKNYANDKLHPADAGYKIWFSEIKRQMK